MRLADVALFATTTTRSAIAAEASASALGSVVSPTLVFRRDDDVAVACVAHAKGTDGVVAFKRHVDHAALLRAHRLGALTAARFSCAIGKAVRQFFKRFLTPIEVAFNVDGNAIAVFAFDFRHHTIDEVLQRFERAAFAADQDCGVGGFDFDADRAAVAGCAGDGRFDAHKLHDFAHQRLDFRVGRAVKYLWRRRWFAFARLGARRGFRSRSAFLLRSAVFARGTRIARFTMIAVVSLLPGFALRPTRVALRLRLTLRLLAARLLGRPRFPVIARLLLQARRVFVTWRMILARRTCLLLFTVRGAVTLRFRCADIGGNAQFYVARAKAEQPGAAFVDDLDVYFVAFDAELL